MRLDNAQASLALRSAFTVFEKYFLIFALWGMY